MHSPKTEQLKWNLFAEVSFFYISLYTSSLKWRWGDRDQWILQRFLSVLELLCYLIWKIFNSISLFFIIFRFSCNSECLANEAQTWMNNKKIHTTTKATQKRANTVENVKWKKNWWKYHLNVNNKQDKFSSFSDRGSLILI